MYAILSPHSRVVSLHSSRANMESAYGRLMSNSLHWPHGPRIDYVLCEIHTTRHKGDFVDLSEYTLLAPRSKISGDVPALCHPQAI